MRRFLSAVLPAVAMLACAGGAGAVPVSGTYTFSASGFTGPGIAPSVSGSFVAAYDLDISNQVTLTEIAISPSLSITSGFGLYGNGGINAYLVGNAGVPQPLVLAMRPSLSEALQNSLLATDVRATSFTYSFTPAAPVPAPAGLAVMGVALAGLGAVRAGRRGAAAAC